MDRGPTGAPGNTLASGNTQPPPRVRVRAGMRQRLVLTALLGAAVVLAAGAPSARAVTRCPAGEAVQRAQPRHLYPKAGDLAERGREGVVFRQTKGGRLVVCEDLARAYADPRRLRFVATVSRIGRRDRVAVAAVEGRSRVAWWVDRPGTGDRVYQRTVGRQASRARSVAAALTRSRGKSRVGSQAVLAVGVDGTVAWLRTAGKDQTLLRARPGQRTTVAARCRAVLIGDAVLVESLRTSSGGGYSDQRWTSDATLLQSPQALPGPTSWIQLPGEAAPGPQLGPPASAWPNDSPMLVDGGVAAWIARTGSPLREELHVLDADGHRVIQQVVAPPAGATLSNLQIDGTTVRYRRAGEDRAATARPAAAAADSGRRARLMPLE